MSSTKSTRLGVVGLSASGASWFSRAHLPYIQGAGSTDYSITALANSSSDAAKRSVEKYNLPPETATYSSAQDIVSDANVDYVVVSVKVPDHYTYIKPALEAGKNVFVEWPLARTLADAEELTRLAREKGVKHVVGLQARQAGSIRKAKQMVAEGKLGKIIGTTMLGSGVSLGPVTKEDHLYLGHLENGANLVTIPVGHAIDALCFVLGEWEWLQAALEVRRGEYKVVGSGGEVVSERETYTSHDYVAINGKLAQGGGVVSVVYQGGMSRTGKDFYWEINGEKGSLILEAKMGHVQMFPATLKFVSADQGAELEDVNVDGPEGVDFSYGVALAWEAALGRGQGSVTTFDDALVRHRMIDAIYRSNESGKRETYLQ